MKSTRRVHGCFLTLSFLRRSDQVEGNCDVRSESDSEQYLTRVCHHRNHATDEMKELTDHATDTFMALKVSWRPQTLFLY
jgi:hypothetical protein